MTESNTLIKTIINHVERYETTKPVQDALSRRISFEDQVLQFYDIEKSIKVGKELKYIAQTNSRRILESPTTLTDILDVFCSENIDVTNLEYDSVRQDMVLWNNPFREKVQNYLETISAFAGLFGISGCAAFAWEKNPKLALVSGAVGVAGGLLLYWTLAHFPAPKGTDYSFPEFLKLHDAAITADNFMMTSYRDHFIGKHISENK